jgi:hypothetical protein
MSALKIADGMRKITFSGRFSKKVLDGAVEYLL